MNVDKGGYESGVPEGIREKIKKKAQQHQEVILSVLKKEESRPRDISQSTEFYFQKALDKFKEFMDFPGLSATEINYHGVARSGRPPQTLDFYAPLIQEVKNFFDSKQNKKEKNENVFIRFLKKFPSGNPEFQLLELTGQLVAYLDFWAANKNEWNEYLDNRYIAKANVKQNYWVINLLNYKVRGLKAVSAPSVQNILRFLLDPANEINVLSEKHRQQIAEKLLGITYQGELFFQHVFVFFSSILTIPSNPLNRGAFFASLLYSGEIRKLWDEKKEEAEQEKADTEETDKKMEDAEDKNPAGTRRVPSANLDEPAEADHLGRQSLINALSCMLANPEQQGPLTIGLFGDWGAGKTTVMNLVEKKLDVKNRDKKNAVKCHFIEFNAWAHEHMENLHAGFAQKIVEGLVKTRGFWGRLWLRGQFAATRYRSKFWFPVAIIAGSLILIALGFFLDLYSSPEGSTPINDFTQLILKLGAVAGISGAALHSIFKVVELSRHPVAESLKTYLKLPEYGEHLGLIPILQEDIKTLANITLKKKNRLIVKIDDLDRCRGKNIMKTLEAVRLVMDLKNVFCIIAIDARIALEAVSSEYAKLTTSSRRPDDIARDYLGKIIQLPIHLPDPNDTEVTDCINNVILKRSSSTKTKQDQLGGKEEETGGTNPVPVENQGDEEKQAPPSPKSHTDSSGPAHSPESSPSLEEPGVDAPSQPPTEIQMEENNDERESFLRYAKLFKFKNPRQLLRLRNSYRLLKALFKKKDAAPVMFSLFLVEYSDSHPGHMKIEGENVILNREAVTLLGAELAEQLTGEIQNLEIAELSSLTTLARYCTLPTRAPDNNNQ